MPIHLIQEHEIVYKQKERISKSSLNQSDFIGSDASFWRKRRSKTCAIYAHLNGSFVRGINLEVFWNCVQWQGKDDQRVKRLFDYIKSLKPWLKILKKQILFLSRLGWWVSSWFFYPRVNLITKFQSRVTSTLLWSKGSDWSNMSRDLQLLIRMP